MDRGHTQISMNIALVVPTQTALCENVGTGSRPRPQRKSDDLLRVAHTINSRGIDPVNAEVERAVDRRDRLFVVLFTPAKFPTRAADGPSAEANGSNEQIRITKA